MGHRRRMRRRRRAHRTHVRWIIDAAFINIFNLFIFILLRSILVFGLFVCGIVRRRVGLYLPILACFI